MNTSLRTSLFGLLLMVSAACGSSDFASRALSGRNIEFTLQGNLGSGAERLPFVSESASETTFDMTARRADGSVDIAYNGWLRLSVKPGSVDSVRGGEFGTISGRNVRFVDGVAKQITLQYRGAYGETAILASDLGYDKTSTGAADPACSDGIDNNGNGVIDFPADPGCESPDDETENGGSYEVWASPIIHYAFPRVSDVRGRERSGASTPLKFQQVRLDTGYAPRTSSYAFKVIVTRIASNGFYVTDIDDTRGYSSIFLFNFNAPPGMRVCDRIQAISGTATEFFGSVQMSFPAWQLEQWQPPQVLDGAGNLVPNPNGWECEVPAPVQLLPAAISVPKTMLRLVHALVVADTNITTDAASGLVTQNQLHISSAFGPEFPKENPSYSPFKRTYPDNSRFLMTENASNCDFNRNGTVDFDEQREADCSQSCDRFPKKVVDPTNANRTVLVAGTSDCTEYSNYISRNSFRVVVTSTSGTGTAGGSVTGDTLQADLSTIPQADPFALRGKPLQTLRGTLNYFSGGSQFTIQARCSDDLATFGTQAKPYSTACILPRTEQELEETN